MEIDIGTVVRTIRKARGLTALDLAQRMGLGQPQVINLETGRCGWRCHTVRMAARALGMRPFVLLMAPDERRRAKLIFG